MPVNQELAKSFAEFLNRARRGSTLTRQRRNLERRLTGKTVTGMDPLAVDAPSARPRALDHAPTPPKGSDRLDGVNPPPVDAPEWGGAATGKGAALAFRGGRGAAGKMPEAPQAEQDRPILWAECAVTRQCVAERYTRPHQLGEPPRSQHGFSIHHRL